MIAVYHGHRAPASVAPLAPSAASGPLQVRLNARSTMSPGLQRGGHSTVRSCAAGALTAGLVVISALVLLYEFFWQIAVLGVLLAGLYLLWENLRELTVKHLACTLPGNPRWGARRHGEFSPWVKIRPIAPPAGSAGQESSMEVAARAPGLSIRAPGLSISQSRTGITLTRPRSCRAAHRPRRPTGRSAHAGATPAESPP
jgi:hypothetical protein